MLAPFSFSRSIFCFTSSYSPYVLHTLPHVLGVYFTALPTSSSGVSGVRIVNMIYGPSCWPAGKSGHSTGQDTPHFTPNMPSQALCRQYSRHSQSLSFFLSLYLFLSQLHPHTPQTVTEEERVRNVKRLNLCFEVHLYIQNICNTRLKTQTSLQALLSLTKSIFFFPTFFLFGISMFVTVTQNIL